MEKKETISAAVKSWKVNHEKIYNKNRQKILFDDEFVYNYVVKLIPEYKNEAIGGMENKILKNKDLLVKKLCNSFQRKDSMAMSFLYFILYDKGYQELANRNYQISKQDNVSFITKCKQRLLQSTIFNHSLKSGVMTKNEWDDYVVTTNDHWIKNEIDNLNKEDKNRTVEQIIKVPDCQRYIDRIGIYLKSHNDRLGVGALMFELKQHNVICKVSHVEFREALVKQYPDIEFTSSNNYQTGYNIIKDDNNRRRTYPEIYAALDQVFVSEP